MSAGLVAPHHIRKVCKSRNPVQGQKRYTRKNIQCCGKLWLSKVGAMPCALIHNVMGQVRMRSWPILDEGLMHGAVRVSPRGPKRLMRGRLNCSWLSKEASPAGSPAASHLTGARRPLYVLLAKLHKASPGVSPRGFLLFRSPPWVVCLISSHLGGSSSAAGLRGRRAATRSHRTPLGERAGPRPRAPPHLQPAATRSHRKP
jgi:hypothetical protein